MKIYLPVLNRSDFNLYAILKACQWPSCLISYSFAEQLWVSNWHSLGEGFRRILRIGSPVLEFFDLWL